MKEAEIYKVEYTDSKDQTSSRTIMPTFVPSENINAIDLSELTEEERAEIQQLYVEYKDYVNTLNKNIYSFEDFISHTKGKVIQPKWRKFNTNRLKQK